MNSLNSDLWTSLMWEFWCLQYMKKSFFCLLLHMSGTFAVSSLQIKKMIGCIFYVIVKWISELHGYLYFLPFQKKKRNSNSLVKVGLFSSYCQTQRCRLARRTEGALASNTAHKPRRAGSWQRTSSPSPGQPPGTAREKVKVCHGGSSTDFYITS